MQGKTNPDIKTVLLYASAVHNSKIVDNSKIAETLAEAKKNGFGEVIIIKKTQMMAKTRSLSKNFIVSPYPASSLNKAIASANACIIVNGVISTKRKNTTIDRILNEANKKMKFIFCLSMEP